AVARAHIHVAKQADAALWAGCREKCLALALTKALLPPTGQNVGSASALFDQSPARYPLSRSPGLRMNSARATSMSRRHSVAVNIGGVQVGGGAPVVVQSMTNTDTADVESTASQVVALARAGSELVRITVDRDESAAAVPKIRDRVRAKGCLVPLVGDFHYIGHKLLADHPACAEALDKYRINPGNVGFKEKKDRQFSAIVETAIRHGK